MKLSDVVVIKEEKQRIDEAFPVALLIWVGAAIATAIGWEAGRALIEKWMIYMDKVNFNPDPDAIPDGMKMRGKDGKWIKYNASTGKWRIPAGSPSLSRTEIADIWYKAMSQGKSARMFRRHINFSDVDEDKMARAIYAAKIKDVEGLKSEKKSLDDLQKRWVQKNKDATTIGKIKKNALRFFRMAGLTGGFLSVTSFAYYYITAREIKEAIDMDYASGAIKTEAEYEQAITEARATFLPIATASIMAWGLSNFAFFLVTWVLDKVTGKYGTAGKIVKHSSRLVQLGVGGISAYYVASERGRASMAELMTDVTFADDIDQIQEAAWNWLGGNYQKLWGEKGLADPDMQTSIDAGKQEDPKTNPDIKVPSVPSSGESNLEKFF